MSGQVWSTTGHSMGRWYAEVTFSDNAPDGAVGLYDEASDTGTLLKADGSVEETVDGVVVTTHAAVFPPLAAGDVVGIKASLDTGELWFRVNGGGWNNGPPDFVFPNASNTGPTGTLDAVAHEGQITLAVEGEVYENKSITGVDSTHEFAGFLVLAPNVTIRNCEFVVLGGFYGIDCTATGLKVQDCRIIGPGYDGNGNDGINGATLVERCDVSLFENGMRIGSGALIRNNYVHDLEAMGADPHYDGIACHGASNVVIERNTIISRDTSCVFLINDYGPVTDVTVDHNYMGGVSGYPMHVADGHGGGPVTYITITNNIIEHGVYGYITVPPGDLSTYVIEGNVDAADGDQLD